ncbi:MULTISPECIES: amino acid ABC transporter permease [unclassified Minwuia]|jgi:general L-amino acid transport system permease protein|uniref:amino acid ABC transporter permease n=1 Tax=unclassified Minwuia TaxID=2618799 RepID=UPI00247AF6BD|nr:MULTISPECIES: amino acid ABC transporter permease [unclassified Minwuia]
MNDSHKPFVAAGDIPPSPPPSSVVGPVAWMRENLFSSIPNAIMTLVGAFIIYSLLASVIPWLFLDSVWNATSLGNCREIDEGACLAVIKERYLQFIYGFYPEEERWRSIVAFVLMIVAVWPVLFAGAPRKMLYVSALYPAVAYWLIWGGTIWGPVGVMLGPVIAIIAYRILNPVLRGTSMEEGIAGILAILLAGLVLVLWWLFGVEVFDGILSSVVFIGLPVVESSKIGGFLLSLIIGVSGIAGSFPLGIALALGRRSNLLFIKAMSTGFIEFVRGVPLITLLFVASTLLNYFLPPGTSFDIILRVVIMVTLFAAAYMAEVIRGGLAALPKGQYEAADALGLDYWKSMRLIILPQALKISIPGIVNTFIGLFKDTTLVSVIGLLDPVGILNPIRADQNWNGIVWELYGFIAIFFFIFCFGMSRYSMYLERKLQTGHR